MNDISVYEYLQTMSPNTPPTAPSNSPTNLHTKSSVDLITFCACCMWERQRVTESHGSVWKLNSIPLLGSKLRTMDTDIQPYVYIYIGLKSGVPTQFISIWVFSKDFRDVHLSVADPGQTAQLRSLRRDPFEPSHCSQVHHFNQTERIRWWKQHIVTHGAFRKKCCYPKRAMDGLCQGKIPSFDSWMMTGATPILDWKKNPGAEKGMSHIRCIRQDQRFAPSASVPAASCYLSFWASPSWMCDDSSSSLGKISLKYNETMGWIASNLHTTPCCFTHEKRFRRQSEAQITKGGQNTIHDMWAKYSLLLFLEFKRLRACPCGYGSIPQIAQNTIVTQIQRWRSVRKHILWCLQCFNHKLPD